MKAFCLVVYSAEQWEFLMVAALVALWVQKMVGRMAASMVWKKENHEVA
jgi:hypothetical protein